MTQPSPVPPDLQPVPLTEPLVACQPGDVIVTQVYSGFLLGRVIPKVGLGPWWTFIDVVSDFDAATEHARTMAVADGVRAWLQKPGDEYDPL